jgi:hypothetical protein
LLNEPTRAKPLTAKIAKKSRKGREEVLALDMLFFANFAEVLRALCGQELCPSLESSTAPDR